MSSDVPNRTTISAPWPTKAIEEHLQCVIDYRGKTPPKSPYGIPTLTAANVKNGRVDLKGVSYVSPETYERWTTRGLPKPGDVLITTEAPVGEVAPFPGDQTYLITRRVIALRGRVGELDNRFLMYALLSPQAQAHLASRVRGTTVPRVLKPDILGVQLPIPSIEEQRAVAHVLGTLDDKIELNRRKNETLEEMARAIFKSWFVDFDPVKAKADGCQPVGMDAETAALFPDSFEDSAMGPIPTGWLPDTISGLARFVNGRNFTKGASGDGRMVIRIAELNSGPGKSTVYNDVEAAPDNIAQTGDTLFAWSGSLGVHRWFRDEAVINQHIFKVVIEKNPQWFVFRHLERALPFFRGIAADKSTTMGHIKRSHLSEVPLAIPCREVLTAAEKLHGTIWNMTLVNELQAATLAELRDTLLPRLVSGQLRIPDAENLLAEAPG